jgi:rare lipoprotein A (peptidoglycan hydrolase)
MYYYLKNNIWWYIIITAIVYWLCGFIIAISAMPELMVDTTPVPHVAKVIQAKPVIASWYDYSLDGIEWSKTHRTCASRTLKRGTTHKITNLANGKSVECYVNDYIEHPDREIDLSSYAFSQIADLKLGLIKVKIE